MPSIAPRVSARRPGILPTRFSIQTLGACYCAVNGVRIEPTQWRSQRALELFLLIIHSDTMRVSRATASDHLWPHLLGDAANNNLRVALHRMRAALEPHRSSPTVVVADHTSIAITLPSGSTIDSDAYRHAIAAARRCADPKAALPLLRRACDAYTGHFLDTITLPEWAIPRRAQYTNDYVEAALRLGNILLDRALYTELHERMWRLLELDPHNDAAHHLLQRAYSATGNHPMAARIAATTAAQPTPFDPPTYRHALSS